MHAAYLNAGRTRNPYFTLLEIAKSMGVDAPVSGWQVSHLKMEFEGRRESEPMIVAVDETYTADEARRILLDRAVRGRSLSRARVASSLISTGSSCNRR